MTALSSWLFVSRNTRTVIFVGPQLLHGCNKSTSEQLCQRKLQCVNITACKLGHTAETERAVLQGHGAV